MPLFWRNVVQFQLQALNHCCALDVCCGRESCDEWGCPYLHWVRNSCGDRLAQWVCWANLACPHPDAASPTSSSHSDSDWLATSKENCPLEQRNHNAPSYRSTCVHAHKQAHTHNPSLDLSVPHIFQQFHISLHNLANIKTVKIIGRWYRRSNLYLVLFVF